MGGGTGFYHNSERQLEFVVKQVWDYATFKGSVMRSTRLGRQRLFEFFLQVCRRNLKIEFRQFHCLFLSMFSEGGKMKLPDIGSAQISLNASGPAGSKKSRSPKLAQIVTGTVPPKLEPAQLEQWIFATR